MLGKFSAILTEKQIGVSSTILKGVHLKRKEFAPFGSQFFSFRVDFFSEERQNNSDRVVSPDSVSILLNAFDKYRKVTVFKYLV